MTGLIGSTAMDADQKLDESRLQLKLAGAELRTAGEKLSARELRQAVREARAKADEAMDAARDRAADSLRLARLRAELEARSGLLRRQLQAQGRGGLFGAGRLLRAFPRLRHGRRGLSLEHLRRLLWGDDD